MRIVTSVAASAHHLEDDPLVDDPLLQVVMAGFAALDDFVELACFVELDDSVELACSVELGESVVCWADQAGRSGEFRSRDDCQGDCRAFPRGDCLGYIRDVCRVCLRGDYPVCIQDECLAYRLGGCRVYIRGGCRDDIRVGSLRACCSRDGCRSLADGSLADDIPSCHHSRDDDSIRQVVGDTSSWADDSHRASHPMDRGCSRCCGLPSSIPNRPIPRDDC
jgi:hypothetical protein